MCGLPSLLIAGDWTFGIRVLRDMRGKTLFDRHRRLVHNQVGRPLSEIRVLACPAFRRRLPMKQGTILIVQNDEHILSLLREHFERAGHHVLTTADGSQAAALARQELPQSVILDLDLPGLDAASVTKELRSSPRTRHIHITLLTPRGERNDKLSALSAGADEFLNKPVDVEELGLRVRNALRRAAFDNLMNPVTGLPGPRLIEEQLRGILRRRTPWAIMRLSLNGLNPFSDVYGFLAGEEVLRFAAHILGQTVEKLGATDDFVGHSGGDSFVIITAPEWVEALSAEMRARFDEDVKMHYSFREREQGYLVCKDADGNDQRVPLMTLHVHTLTSADGPFSDIFELTQALG
jgi:PleD family two-component response regulator